MKMKKLISSALVAVLLFGAVIGVMPIKAEAAYTTSNATNESTLGKAEIWDLVEGLLMDCSYGSAEEMLEADKDYLVPVNYDTRYTLSINKYTGFVYYKDNLTGQILTSNPYNYPKVYGTAINDINADMASQLVIAYSEISKNTTSYLYSSVDAALNAQISVEYIANGLRVNYTLGDTVARYLLPGYITAEKFEAELLVPMLNEFRDLLREYCGEMEADFTAEIEKKETKLQNAFDIFQSSKHNLSSTPPSNRNEEYWDDMLKKYSVYYKDTLNHNAVYQYLLDMRNRVIDVKYTDIKGNKSEEGHQKLNTLYKDIMTIYGSGEGGYYLRNLKRSEAIEGKVYSDNLKDKYYSNPDSEISKTLEPIYEFVGKNTQLYHILNCVRIFTKYMPDYNFEKMIADEKYCGVDLSGRDFELRYSIEYSFNADGDLCVRVLDKTSDADKAKANVVNITVLESLNYGDGIATDGSVTVIDLDG